MEQITGPICGFHLACYTVEAPEGVFAYAKVCELRPQCVWTAASPVAKVGVGPFAHEAAAIAAVTTKAREKLEGGLQLAKLSRLLSAFVAGVLR
jgi:hypothetical protein